jgi:hypothetical protein
MTDHYHAVVWIDHHQARVIHFNPTDAERDVVHPHHPEKNIHSHALPRGSNHGTEDQNYLHAVVEAFAKAKAVLITGPSNEKNELIKHIEHHDPSVLKIIAGVEAAEQLTDRQLLAHARKFFEAYDRMHSQK